MAEQARKKLDLSDRICPGEKINVSINNGEIKEMTYFGFKDTEYGKSHIFISRKGEKQIIEWSCFEHNIRFFGGVIGFDSNKSLLETIESNMIYGESGQKYQERDIMLKNMGM